MTDLYKKIWTLLNQHERKRAFQLLFLMILMAFLEVLGVGSIMPFLSVLGNPETIETNKYLNATYTFLNFQNKDSFLMFLGLFALFMLLASATVRSVTSYAKIPDDITKNLSKISKKEIVKIVDKNPLDAVDSKSITTFEDSIEHATTKYLFDDERLQQYSSSQYLIIDDVFGNGSTIFTVLKKLYDINHMLNYFLVVVKDVKR